MQDAKSKAPPLDSRDFFSLDGRPVWLDTGRVRLRVGWFGRPVLEYEQATMIDTRPEGAAYSPGWWKSVTRWRRCRRNDGFLIGCQPPQE